MGSRVVVVGQEQPRGRKQKNGKQEEGRTRRVLGDIGNLGPVPNGQQQISRPITRGLKTRLLANAQKEIEKNNKKKAQVTQPLPKAINGIVASDNGDAAANKKDTHKPNPEKVVTVAAKSDNGGEAAQKKEADKVNPEKVVMVATKFDNGGAEAVAAHKKEADKPNPENAVMVPNSGKGVMVVAEPNDRAMSKGNKSGKKIKKSSQKTGNKKAFTSVLTARSEAVSGFVPRSKPEKELIVNIDVPDIDNELAVVEYIGDIYQFYKLTEEDGRVSNYIDTQPEITIKMRAILVDWLIEVHKKFELMPESLYLTVNIMDRYLSMKTVQRKQLQLVGISSMLIATKYEEIWAPEVSDFIAVSDNTYTRNQILVTEKAILGKLGWYLTLPTPYVFLLRYTKASLPHDPEIDHMVFFFAELGLMDYSTTIKYSPSKLAASAVYAARCTINKLPWWNLTLKHHTGFSEDQVMDCAKMLVNLHSDAAESKLKGVYRKYSSPQWSSVALLPPATRTLLSSPSSSSSSS